MFQLTICDDEPASLLLLEKLVREWAKNRKIEIQIHLCRNAQQLLFLWEDVKAVDILLLDIEMPGMDGMSLAHKLRERQEETEILFVTGFDDYVLAGYDVDAVSYLIKPVKQKQLFFCLDKAAGRRLKKEKFLLFETAEGLTKLRLTEICYLESSAHDTLIHCECRQGGKEQGEHKQNILRCRSGIQKTEQSLEKESRAFFRIHRSFVVNLACVSRITKRDVIMDSGEALPIARGRWEALNRAYLNYYRER